MSSIQTMKAWAIEVKEDQSIPEVFQQTARQILEDCKTFPYTIYAPRNRKTGKPAWDHLLMMTETTVWILEDHDKKVAIAQIPMDGIQSIQMGTVLLQSWIKLCGKSPAGPECVVLYYDTVMGELFIPVMENLRRKMIKISNDNREPQADELDYLKEISLKFYNYGKQSLLPGQRICCSAYQPQSGDLDKTAHADHVTAPHLTILTDEELIIIQETEQAEESATQKYSGIWTHIPVDKIEEVEATSLQESQWEKMSLQFLDQKPVEIVFDPDNHEAIEKLIKQLKLLLK